MSYKAGAPVHFKLTARNDGPSPAILAFRNGQRFDITVLAPPGGDPVWQWSAGMGFIQVLGTLELKAGESKSFDATWDQRDGKGQQVPAGPYKANGWLTASNLRNLATVEFDIR
jgi:hypothetical protein